MAFYSCTKESVFAECQAYALESCTFKSLVTAALPPFRPARYFPLCRHGVCNQAKSHCAILQLRGFDNLRRYINRELCSPFQAPPLTCSHTSRFLPSRDFNALVRSCGRSANRRNSVSKPQRTRRANFANKGVGL
jgi:hypothetical protein